MNKSDLIARVAAATGRPKSETEATIGTALEIIAQSLAAEQDVSLFEFGAFRLVHRHAQPGRKINGKTYDVPARTTVRFKPHAALLKRLPVAPERL